MFRAFALALVLAACGHKSPPSPGPSGSGSESGSAAACPAAKESTDICAQVVTYVKNNDTCCMYPTPCSVPVAGQQYSDDKCTTPMGAAAQ